MDPDFRKSIKNLKDPRSKTISSFIIFNFVEMGKSRVKFFSLLKVRMLEKKN